MGGYGAEIDITLEPLGNCFMACIASIFEVPLENVPHIHEEEIDPLGASDWPGWRRYWNRLHTEFLIPRGFYIMEVGMSEEWHPAGYSILNAKSLRGSWDHSVVAEDGEIVWDPHPKREMGVGDWKVWTLFVPYNPALMGKWVP